jgi:hypothetical protein
MPSEHHLSCLAATITRIFQVKWVTLLCRALDS